MEKKKNHPANTRKYFLKVASCGVFTLEESKSLKKGGGDHFPFLLKRSCTKALTCVKSSFVCLHPFLPELQRAVRYGGIIKTCFREN